MAKPGAITTAAAPCAVFLRRVLSSMSLPPILPLIRLFNSGPFIRVLWKSGVCAAEAAAESVLRSACFAVPMDQSVLTSSASSGERLRLYSSRKSEIWCCSYSNSEWREWFRRGGARAVRLSLSSWVFCLHSPSSYSTLKFLKLLSSLLIICAFSSGLLPFGAALCARRCRNCRCVCCPLLELQFEVGLRRLRC
jgi:hypothetical protein